MTGKEAERLGIVLSSVPQADLMAEALTLAKRIADNGPIAVRTAVRSLR